MIAKKPKPHCFLITWLPAENGFAPRTTYTTDAETQVFNIDACDTGPFALGMTRHNLVVGLDR